MGAIYKYLVKKNDMCYVTYFELYMEMCRRTNNVELNNVRMPIMPNSGNRGSTKAHYFLKSAFGKI